MNLLAQVRPCVVAMDGYAPGEQPRDGQPIIKLNTNENPFGPPQPVIEALHAAINDALRLYPEPSSREVRQAAAAAFGLDADQVVVGNGSDDLLTLLMRTFIAVGDGVAAPDPSYTLYPVLTQLQEGLFHAVPWQNQLDLPIEGLLASGAKLILIARPNAPTGHAVPLEQVAQLCAATTAIVVLDEAYVDFADDNGLPLMARYENLVITRSFSKSLSLAGLRIGLGFLPTVLAQQMHKVRDSYNLDRLAQVAAVAVLRHLDLFQPTIQAIRTERRYLTSGLRQRGFQVPESQANFVLATVPAGRRGGRDWCNDLKNLNILVRYFGHDPRLSDKLRITIATHADGLRLLEAIDLLMENN
ncbi:MAG: histidinol-phosphate transaminase [Magnetococcales bacterium]|nr:histidinol-phosphate transaminase [Magnetococcales bacterium]